MCEPVAWSAPQSLPILGGGEIHVWRGRLTVDEPARLFFCLSDDERERAGRYRFAVDRNRYVTARGLLRCVLARYLVTTPERLRFRYETAGKPALVQEGLGASLDFNLSHSGELAVFAVARNRRIGVDVENVRSNVDTEKIAERFFSPNEVCALRGLPGDMKQDGFFRCWTRKEAYVKACGEGLQIPLDDFDVTLEPGLPALFLRGIDPSWQMLGFVAERGYPAALVYDGAPATVRFLCADHMLAR